MFELIMDWVVGPILGFFGRRYYSGKRHFWYLFPVAAVAFGGIWGLGEHWDSGFLVAIGALGTVIFGLASLITWIPREVGEHRDTEAYIAKRKREVKEIEAQEAADGENYLTSVPSETELRRMDSPGVRKDMFNRL